MPFFSSLKSIFTSSTRESIDGPESGLKNEFFTRISNSGGTETSVNSEGNLWERIKRIGVKNQKYSDYTAYYKLDGSESQALASATDEESFYTILKRGASTITIKGEAIKGGDEQKNLIISALNKMVGKGQTGISATRKGEDIVVNFGTEMQFAFKTAVKLREERKKGISAIPDQEISEIDTQARAPKYEGRIKTIPEMVQEGEQRKRQLATRFKVAKETLFDGRN